MTYKSFQGQQKLHDQGTRGQSSIKCYLPPPSPPPPPPEWLGGVTVRASDLRSSGHGLNSRSDRYHATYVNSAFHPSGVGKSSASLLAGVIEVHVHLRRMAGNTVWSHMASDSL